jgi:hypothetical protein
LISEFDREAITPWGNFRESVNRNCFKKVGSQSLLLLVHLWLTGVITESDHPVDFLNETRGHRVDVVLHGTAAVYSTERELLRDNHAQHGNQVSFIAALIFGFHFEQGRTIFASIETLLCRLFASSDLLPTLSWKRRVLIWIIDL